LADYLIVPVNAPLVTNLEKITTAYFHFQAPHFQKILNVCTTLARAKFKARGLVHLIICYLRLCCLYKLFPTLFYSGKFFWYKCGNWKPFLYIFSWQIIKNFLNCLTHFQRNSPEWNIGRTHIGTLATCRTRCAYME